MANKLTSPESITRLQAKLTQRWHSEEPAFVEEMSFLNLVQENHLRNFTLWHHEDDARRKDKGFKFVCNAKRAIDKNNQQRNDFIEKMDKFLFKQLGDQFPESIPMNSETPGSIIDRLSIMTLKEYHMQEEVDRNDVDQDHIEKCKFKLNIIQQQIQDLKSALQNLLTDCANGTRGFRVYFQFKMYNDPDLNPALYKRFPTEQE